MSSGGTETLIEFRNVYKAFGEKRVLDGVDFKIPSGKITAFIGKSGSGKSVLLKHIAGLMTPDRGEIIYQGDSTEKARSSFKNKFSYMFQNNALLDSMNVYDNVALPLVEEGRLSKSEIDEKISNLFKLLDILDIKTQYTSQISGGMQKRVALARALITDPEVILFDEPTTGLDPLRKNVVINLISEYQLKFGFTAVIVSHDIPDIFYICDHVVILNEGKIGFSGSPLELESIENETIKSFLNSQEHLLSDLMGLLPCLEFDSRLKLLESSDSYYVSTFRVDGFERFREKVGSIASEKLINVLARNFSGNQSAVNACRANDSSIRVCFENRDVKVNDKIIDALKNDSFFQSPSFLKNREGVSIKYTSNKLADLNQELAEKTLVKF